MVPDCFTRISRINTNPKSSGQRDVRLSARDQVSVLTTDLKDEDLIAHSIIAEKNLPGRWLRDVHLAAAAVNWVVPRSG